MNKTNLAALRRKIRKADEELVVALNERARLSMEIGALKKQKKIEVYDPARERDVYRHLDGINHGPLTRPALHRIYTEVISASRSLQAPVTVAFLGPEASFTHLAARRHFGSSCEFIPLSTVAEIFDQVERRLIPYGVVPIENSLEGSVNMTLDCLIATPLSIRAEIVLPIRHCLLSYGARIDELKHIYSHPQALAQCGNWLKINAPRSTRHTVESTAAAVRRVTGDRESAAIGSVEAAHLYGLRVLAEGIEDYRTNATRFIVIGEGSLTRSGADKTSILFGTRHEPGALFHALEPFAQNRINLVRIESHPIRGAMWEYLFFADCNGSLTDRKVRACLDDVKKKATFFKILGSYPAGDGTA